MAAYFWQRATVAFAMFLAIFLIHAFMSPESTDFFNFVAPTKQIQLRGPSVWGNYTTAVLTATKDGSKNLVIITSMINGAKPSKFTPQERFAQLLSSIDSVKSYIPDCFIAVVEGGSKPDQMYVDGIVARGATYWHYDVSKMPKAVGDAQLLYSFLRMPHDLSKYKSISKLSGRYQVTKDLEFNSTDLNDCLAKIDYAQGVVETRYYRIPTNVAPNLKHALLLMLLPHDGVRDHVKIDKDDTLDEILYKTKLFQNNRVKVPKVLGVTGMTAADGKKRNY